MILAQLLPCGPQVPHCKTGICKRFRFTSDSEILRFHSAITFCSISKFNQLSGTVYILMSVNSLHWTRSRFNTCVHVCVLSCFSHVQLFVTPWTVAHQAPLAIGKNAGVGCHALLEGISQYLLNSCCSQLTYC